MNPNKKVLITVLSFVLAMVVIACSCSSLIPAGIISPSNNEAMVGKWQDTETTFIYTISSSGGSYQVTSVLDNNGASVPVASQSWDGSKLTWSVTDPANSYTLTYITQSVSGDSLNVKWQDSDGKSGTDTLKRVP